MIKTGRLSFNKAPSIEDPKAVLAALDAIQGNHKDHQPTIRIHTWVFNPSAVRDPLITLFWIKSGWFISDPKEIMSAVACNHNNKKTKMPK